jgi:hypothetical protein
MADVPHLQDYVTTHLTVAAVATNMLKGLANRLDADDLRGMIAELRQEQQVLDGVLSQLDVSHNPVLRGAAVVGERATRIVRDVMMWREDDKRDLSELEALLTGVEGKKGMWRLFLSVQEDLPVLESLPLQDLLDQADRQSALVETHRMAAGRRMLT